MHCNLRPLHGDVAFSALLTGSILLKSVVPDLQRFSANTQRYAVTLTFDPLTLNVLVYWTVPLSLRSNYVTNIFAKQFAAELQQF